MSAEPLRVAARTNVRDLAGAIAGFIREEGSVELRTIGAGALNQAVKAVAIALQYFASQGVCLCITPFFAEGVEIDGEERTPLGLKIRRHVAV